MASGGEHEHEDFVLGSAFQDGKRPSGALAISASIGLQHPFVVRSIIPFGPDR
jgi:hypothetical protein